MSLRGKLARLLREKEGWEKREGEYSRQVGELEEEISKLRHALADSERMRADMHTHMEQVTQEATLLRRQSARSDQPNFRDFVGTKRELVALKEENEQLKIQLHLLLATGASEKRLELPKIKDNKNGKKSKLVLR